MPGAIERLKRPSAGAGVGSFGSLFVAEKGQRKAVPFPDGTGGSVATAAGFARLKLNRAAAAFAGEVEFTVPVSRSSVLVPFMTLALMLSPDQVPITGNAAAVPSSVSLPERAPFTSQVKVR